MALGHVDFENLLRSAAAFYHTAQEMELEFLKCLDRHLECVRWHV